MNDWEVIATFWGLVDAKMASALLANDGIPSRLTDDGVTGAHPLLAIAVGGIRVLVAPEDAQKANALLQARGLLPGAESPAVDPGSLEDEALAAAPADESVSEFLKARKKPRD